MTQKVAGNRFLQSSYLHFKFASEGAILLLIIYKI